MSFTDGTKVVGTFKGDPKLLADPGKVHFFLQTLVREIGMTALGYHVYDVPIAVKRLGQDPLTDEGGVTGIVVLSTSHAALHTWPEEGGGRIDVDSCREFDPRVVKRLVVEFFGANPDDFKLFDVTHALRG